MLDPEDTATPDEVPDDGSNTSFLPHLKEKSSYWKWEKATIDTIRFSKSKQSTNLPNIEVEERKFNKTLAVSFLALDPIKHPTIMCHQPFSLEHNSFRVKVLQISYVIAVGVSDRRLKLNSSKVVGAQAQGFNCSLLWCYSKPISICVNGQSALYSYVHQTISAGDIIEVRLDYENNTIIFFHNGKETGKLPLKKFILKDYELYPCVSMHAPSAVLLVDENKEEKKIEYDNLPKEPLVQDSSMVAPSLMTLRRSKSKSIFHLELNKNSFYNGEKGYGYVICGKKDFQRSKVKEVLLHFWVEEFYRYQCESGNWRYTCGERSMLLEQTIKLWKEEEAKKQVESLFDLAGKIVLRKYDVKKLDIAEEIKEKLLQNAWPFQFQIPFGFPPSFTSPKASFHYSFHVSILTESGSFLSFETHWEN